MHQQQHKLNSVRSCVCVCSRAHIFALPYGGRHYFNPSITRTRTRTCHTGITHAGGVHVRKCDPIFMLSHVRLAWKTFAHSGECQELWAALRPRVATMSRRTPKPPLHTLCAPDSNAPPPTTIVMCCFHVGGVRLARDNDKKK